MATTAYEITLSSGSGAVTSIDTLYIKAVSSGAQYAYKTAGATAAITEITVPTWANGSKTFAGYKNGTVTHIQASGKINTYDGSISTNKYLVSSDETWTAVWNSVCPTCSISSERGTFATSEIFYDATTGKWYLDYPFATEFSASNPIAIPTEECYKFLGCYATNGTTGTKYINEDGTPTAAFLALAPTSDITIYAQWEHVSYKVTLKHSTGSPTSTVFYAKIGATGYSRFYSDDLCTELIYSITPPTRELWHWNGAFSSTTQSSATQLIESDGEFTENLYALPITADQTISTANYWTQVSVKLLLLDSTWTVDTATYYLDKTNGGVYADWLLEEQVSLMAIPSKNGYRFLGYYSTNSTTGTLYIAANGVIQSALEARKVETKIYAQGRAATYTLTLDPNGGTTTEPTIYYDATSGETAFFGTNSSTKTTVARPTYTGNTFLGYYTEAQGGTQVVDASGNILSSWVPTETATVYAHWGIDVSIIDVDAGGGTGGTTRFWHRTSTGKFYSDEDLETEITSISVPSRRLFNLNGLYTDGGALAVNASGVIQSTFNPTDEFVTLAATYTRYAYETAISNGGGEGDVDAIYRAPSGSTWYSDLAMTTAITNVGIPTRTGYTFRGYAYGGTTVIDATGNILSAAAVDEDYTATAAWSAKTYTLTFDGNGATPSFSTKTVTFGSAIGALPTASISGRTFESWQIGGTDISAATVWKFDDSMTAGARWKDYFGDADDYFSLAGNIIMLVGSESGEGRQVTNLWNGAYEKGDNLLNPVCTYRVKASGNVTITLGKAFAAGYMITSAEYRTGADKEPLLVVSGTANEGADAINKYAVRIAVDPDHVAQDPFGAVSGGGELVEMTSAAVCDPVVPYENNEPCASDVVHGRYRVTGRTAAYFGESAPTVRNSFIDAGVPVSNSDVDYTTYAFTAEKGI